MTKLSHLLPAAALLASPLALAESFIPSQGDFSASIGVSFTTFDRFYAGDDLQPGVPGGGDIERLSYRGYFFYGLSDTVALDFSIGYADIESELDSQKEFADTYVGLNWQFADERNQGVDALFRAGIIIEGSYETGQLSAPGDGENGADFSVRLRRSLGSEALKGNVELGYTIYTGGNVPDTFRAKTGLQLALGHGFSIDASAIYFSATDGLDIGGPGFGGLGDLPQVQESGIAGEFGLAYASPYGYYRLGYTELFDGENVGEEKTVGLSVSYTF